MTTDSPLRRKPDASASKWRLELGAYIASSIGRSTLSILIALLAVAPFARAGDGPATAKVPMSPSDLFDSGKALSLHLRFSAEEWAVMESALGTNPSDMSAFGPGMYLTPAVMRDGDTDNSGSLSADEFHTLAEQWFAAWDRDRDTLLDSNQIRDGLKDMLRPPRKAGETEPDDRTVLPLGLNLQGSRGKRNGLASIMGIEFEYVHADLEFEGHTFADVAVRYKGNATFMESRDSIKRPLKIDLNKFVKRQKLARVTTLNLHNNVTDAGMMNEVLAFRLYRDAQVPAPRTAYARVFVTVPGKHERQYFGLYSLVENVDNNFVADRGLDKNGAILKPVTPALFNDLGDDWAAYAQIYDPKTDLTDAQKHRLVDLCRLVSEGSDEDFAARLGEFIDLDEFARFMAVTVWIGDLDSILTTGQNFYLYLDPASDRFQFIPWDKDRTFGSWGAASPAEREQHSIREPWVGRKRFLERAFKVEAFQKRYLAALAKLNDEHARPDQFRERVRELAATIRPFIKEESEKKLTLFETVVAGKPLPGGQFGFGDAPPTPTLLMFVQGRSASIKDQLAGKTEAYVFGKPRSGETKKPPEFRPELMIEPVLLTSLDANKDKKLSREEFVSGFNKWFVAWDANKSGRLTERQIRKGLNKELSLPAFEPPRRKEADEGK